MRKNITNILMFFLIIGSLILGIILVFLLKENICLLFQENYKEEIINIANAVGTTGGALITLCLGNLALFEYYRKKSRERAKEAINVAKYFAEDLTELVSDFSIQFDKFKNGNHGDKADKERIKTNFEKLENLDIKKMVEFNLNELHELLPKEVIQDLDSFYAGVQKANVLNKLEYICMYISKNIADDEYVIRPLYPLFMNTIQKLYPYICGSTSPESYENIKYVFNLWRDQTIKLEEKKKRERKNRIINQKKAKS